SSDGDGHVTRARTWLRVADHGSYGHRREIHVIVLANAAREIRKCDSRSAPGGPAVSVSMLLEMIADAVPDRVGVGTRDAGLSYEKVLTRARRLAALLHERGAERLGLVDRNSDAVPLCLFAAGFAGIPFAPVNYRLADDQLRAILGRLAPALVVVGE